MVEFTLVVGLLTLVTLSVLQLGLALHIRNTVHDAAAEGARYTALADTTSEDGVERTRDLITAAIGPNFAQKITPGQSDYLGYPVAVVTVSATLPVFGLIGFAGGIEVTGRAALETVD